MPKNYYLCFLWVVFGGCTPDASCLENCDEERLSPEPEVIYDDTCWGLAYTDALLLTETGNTAAPCSTQILLDETISLMGDLGEMQVHLDAAFDGSQLYLVYNFADTQSDGMGIAGRTLKCDGALGPEVTISNNEYTQTDPQVAVGENEFMVVWQKDTPEQSPNNLDLLIQNFSLEFTPQYETPQTLEMTRNGNPQEKNAWMPAIAPAYKNGFWVFGARGHDEATAFQTFGQLIHSDGELFCDSIDFHLAPLIGQIYPVAAAVGDTLFLAWESSESDGAKIQFVQTQNGFLHQGQTQMTENTGDAQRPAVALGPDGEQAALAYFIQTGSSTRTYLTHPDHLNEVIAVGAPNQNAHSPAVALGESGGLIFWLENLSGTKNKAYFQAFQPQEGGYELLGAATAIESEKVLPYAPVVLHLGADYYFMGWMAGDHPNYQAYGRFAAPQSLQ